MVMSLFARRRCSRRPWEKEREKRKGNEKEKQEVRRKERGIFVTDEGLKGQNASVEDVSKRE